MSEPPTPRGRFPWRELVAIVAIAYAVAFVLLNDDRVAVSFVVARVETSLVFLILLGMALGALVALIVPAWLRRRR